VAREVVHKVVFAMLECPSSNKALTSRYFVLRIRSDSNRCVGISSGTMLKKMIFCNLQFFLANIVIKIMFYVINSTI